MIRQAIVLLAIALTPLFPVNAQTAGDGAQPKPEESAPAKLELDPGLYATIKTSQGSMVCRLFHKRAPVTVANFIGLAEGKIRWATPESVKSYIDAYRKAKPKNAEEAKKLKAQHYKYEENKPFYDGLTFHRIDRDFIQGGDPKGDGTGGPGYEFFDETHPELLHNTTGILGMAHVSLPGEKAGRRDSVGSQFYITRRPVPDLDGRNSVFGAVVKGLNVLGKLSKLKHDRDGRPAEKIVIESVTIQRVGDEGKNYTLNYPYTRPLPSPTLQAAADLTPDFKTQKEESSVGVQFVLVKFKGKKKSHPELNSRTEAQALARAKELVRLARQPNFKFKDLEQYSDIRTLGRIYKIVKAPKMAEFMRPILKLKEEQVTEPILTPSGFMVFCRPRQVRASHILISYQGSELGDRMTKKDMRSKKEAMAYAKELLEKLKTKEIEFEDAVKFSDDPLAERNRGDVGLFYEDRMVEEFSEAAFKLKVDELCGEVIETRYGFHIILRTE